jgi:hypothetical protein
VQDAAVALRTLLDLRPRKVKCTNNCCHQHFWRIFKLMLVANFLTNFQTYVRLKFFDEFSNKRWPQNFWRIFEQMLVAKFWRIFELVRRIFVNSVTLTYNRQSKI